MNKIPNYYFVLDTQCLHFLNNKKLYSFFVTSKCIPIQTVLEVNLQLQTKTMDLNNYKALLVEQPMCKS